MFCQIGLAIVMAHNKVDYPRKPWTMPFLKMSFPSKLNQISRNRPVFPKIQQKSANFGRFPPKITIVRSKCFSKLSKQQTWQRKKSTIFVNLGLGHFQKYHSHQYQAFTLSSSPGFSKKAYFQKFCCAACAPRGFLKNIFFSENGRKRALFGSF